MTNWQTKKLDDIGTFFKGSGIPKDSSKSGDLPAVRYGELYTSFDIFINQVQSSIDQSTAMSAAKILKGDILFAGSGETVEEIGKSAVYQLDQEGYAGGDIVIMRPGSDQDSRFLGQALNSDEARKQLRKFGQGQSVVHVYRKDLEKLELLLPEKPEQERIVGVLEVWDEYTEKLEQKIALKEQLKKGLMQQLLTGKRRLPGFDGNWQKLKLSDIAEIRKGTQLNRSTLSDNRVGLNKYAVINGGIAPSGYTDSHNTKAGTITVSEGGNSCGYVNYIKEDFWLGGHCYEIINNQKVDQIYLYPFLKAIQSKIMSLRVGSGLPNIQKSSLDKLTVLLPTTKREQEEIGMIMLHSVTEIEQLEEKLQILKLQKKYLLKNLITGTIRTPEDLKPLDTSRLERSAL